MSSVIRHMHLSFLFHILFDGVDGQDHARNRPGLGLTGESVGLSISVGQLGKTSPIVAIQISGMVLQQCIHLIGLQILVEIAFGFNVESVEPNPLGSIVVAESMSHLDVRRVIAVIVVRHIQRFVEFSQSGKSDGVIVNEFFLNYIQIRKCVFWVEKLGSQSQGY
jgi:hypothetical protein